MQLETKSFTESLPASETTETGSPGDMKKLYCYACMNHRNRGENKVQPERIKIDKGHRATAVSAPR
jgi:hypothetical protein